MADNITGRAERPDLDDNDPFAELTRIMGRDPRQTADEDGEGDLVLDLENELLGTLDLSSDPDPEADATADANEQPWMEEAPEAVDAPQYSEVPAEPVETAPSELDFSDFDAELNAAFDNRLDDHPALAEELPVAADDLADEFSGADQLFDAEYRAVDDLPDADHRPAAADGTADWQDQDWQQSAATVPASPLADEWADTGETPLEPSPAADADDWSSAFQADTQPESEPEMMAAEPAEDSFEFDDELMMALQAEPVSEGSDAFSTPEESAFEAPPTAPYEDLAHEAAVDDAAVDDYVTSAQEVEIPRRLSLEEELTMLLAGADKPRAEPAPAFEAPVARPPMPQRAGEPVAQVSTAEGAAPAPATMSRSTWQSRQPPQSDREIPEIETVEMATFEPIRSAEFDVPDLPVNEPVQAASEFDDLAAELSRAFEVGDEQSPRDGPDPSYGASRGDVGAEPHRQPDIDWETVVAPANAGHGPEHPAQDTYYENDHIDADAGAHTPVAGGFAAYRHDDVLAQELPETRPARRDDRRRNTMVAVGALMLLLLGGVGVFALWSGGGPGSGEPVLLQADADPVRVRPDEPGGTVVPNQDSEVYQRVAGGREESEPSQARLIDTAEEPIDLTVQSGPRIVGPGADGEAGFGADISDVKVEDRQDADSDLAAAGTSDDVIALQPRRVRTMVVRPDGSIVPREVPAPAAEVQAESTTAAAAPQALEQSNAESTVQATETAESETDIETATSMPQEIALAPATRPEPPADQPAPAPVPLASTPTPAPAPAQQEQQVAAVEPAPAAPQATQTSEWSMQIASQPSSDSAQATYQDLARRYSSLLEGRGVNIVRAQVDGRTFYRVRIPMASRDEAVNLCTRYQSAGGSCFVSR